VTLDDARGFRREGIGGKSGWELPARPTGESGLSQRLEQQRHFSAGIRKTFQAPPLVRQQGGHRFHLDFDLLNLPGKIGRLACRSLLRFYLPLKVSAKDL
jgi:hypothetical protein